MQHSKKIRIGLPFLFLLAFFYTAIQVQAVEYGGIGGRPANPDPSNPRTESIFVHTGTPGQTITDGIRLLNNTPETKTLLVYGVDSIVSSGGAFSCAQNADAHTEVGNWITLDKHEVTLESLTNEVVPFTITFPQNAGVGEHNGCIVIQEKKGNDPKPGQNGILLSFRTGIRVALLVPGDIVRELAPAGFSYIKKDSNFFTFMPKVKNTGNVSIDATVNVKINSIFGPHIADLGGEYPVLRGETSEWNFDLKRPFWGGWYKAKASVTYDANEGASLGVTSGGALTTLDIGTVRFFSMPSTQGLLIEVGILIVILGFLGDLFMKRRRHAWIRKSWIPYIVHPGDDIKSIAEHHAVSWKLVAKVNGLKPPYAIHPGETIKVPPVA